MEESYLPVGEGGLFGNRAFKSNVPGLPDLFTCGLVSSPVFCAIFNKNLTIEYRLAEVSALNASSNLVSEFLSQNRVASSTLESYLSPNSALSFSEAR